jgi:chromosome segregation ATPase
MSVTATPAVSDWGAAPGLAAASSAAPGARRAVVGARVNGPFAGAIRHAIGDAWIAPDYDGAPSASRLTRASSGDARGDVFRGPHLVSGGGARNARGILETKREIKELRERIGADRDSLARLAEETAQLEGTIAQASQAIAALNAEHHKQEKAVVGYEAQLQHASDEQSRLVQKSEQLARERYQSETSATASIAGRKKRGRRSPGWTTSSGRPTSG